MPAKSLGKVQQENGFDVLSQAFQMAQSFNNAQLKAQALIDIASGYAAVGEKEKASEILFQALKVSQALQLNQADFYTINSNPSKFHLLFDIAVGYAALGQKEKAFEILHKVFQITQKLDLSDQELDPIAEAYAAAEKYDQVLLASATMNSETVASVLPAVSRKLASIFELILSIRECANAISQLI